MLNSTICGSVAFSIKSPNFSTLRQAWKGSCSSEPARRVVTKPPRDALRDASTASRWHRVASTPSTRPRRRGIASTPSRRPRHARRVSAPPARSELPQNRKKNHRPPPLVETRRINEVHTGRGPLITMFGKSSKCTSSGSSMPLRVTIICLGCSSTGSERMRAATCDRGVRIHSNSTKKPPTSS